jgi:hypothetical protein
MDPRSPAHSGNGRSGDHAVIDAAIARGLLQEGAVSQGLHSGATPGLCEEGDESRSGVHPIPASPSEDAPLSAFLPGHSKHKEARETAPLGKEAAALGYSLLVWVAWQICHSVSARLVRVQILLHRK